MSSRTVGTRSRHAAVLACLLLSRWTGHQVCVERSYITLDHLRQQVERVAVDAAAVVQDGRLDLGVIRPGGDHAAAAPAPHEEDLDENLLSGVVAWQPRPEGESPHGLQLATIVEDAGRDPGDLVAPPCPRR